MTDEIRQESVEAQVDLRDYWNVIVKRRWTVVAFLVVTITLVTIFTLRQTKIYEAKASVIIEPYAPQVLGDVREVYNLGAGSYWSNKEYYETQYNIITSRAVAQKVVSALQIEGNREFLGIDKLQPEDQKKYLEDKEARGEKIDYVEEVRKLIKVESVKDSRAAVLKTRHQSPKWAQRLANATVNAYIDHNRQTRQQVTMDAAGWLGTQLNELKARMQESESALFEFKKSNDIISVSLQDRQNMTTQKLEELSQTLNRVQAERIALESRRKQILDVRDKKLPLDSLEKVIDNNLIQDLKRKYLQVREDQAEVGEKYLPGHPRYVSLENRASMLRESIDREIDKVLGSMEAEYRTKLETERSLQKAVGQVKDEAQSINQKEIDYNRLKRVADNYAALHQLVLTRQKEATLASHQETNNVYKLDAAIEPLLPVYPRVRLNVLLAVVVGLLGGIGLAFFLEYLDNSIKSQEDVEKYLHVPFLGIIPSIKLIDPGAEGKQNTPMRDNYLLSHPKSSVAECCRTVRTNILFMTPDNPARRLLVTSSQPEEGKSTASINLSITMAQGGSRVLLVDTDLRRPRLHKTFGVKTGMGITTAILGEGSLEEVIHHSEIPGLDLLPCGPVPPNPTELLHTDRFARIVEQLSEMYDRVIFDSPPVLVVADPLILSRLMDGVVVVIKSSHTARDLPRVAIRQLKDMQARILGVVLNDLDLEHREYGYYYYRRYGYYYGEREHDVATT